MLRTLSGVIKKRPDSDEGGRGKGLSSFSYGLFYSTFASKDTLKKV